MIKPLVEPSVNQKKLICRQSNLLLSPVVRFSVMADLKLTE